MELKQQFPGVDFSLVEHDEDPLWIEDKRETLLEIRVRSALYSYDSHARTKLHVQP